MRYPVLRHPVLLTRRGASVRLHDAEVFIEAPSSVGEFKANDWVDVEGQIRFDKFGTKYVAVLKVPSMDKIRRTAPEPDTYVR